MARALEPYRDRELPNPFLRWLEILRTRIKNIPSYTEIDGSPEGVLAGQQGDFALDRVAGLYYLKTTNGGTSGWIFAAGWDYSTLEADRVIAGDPGTEGTGITIGGTLYESALKASALGGTNQAQFIMHRHSTTIGPVIVGARTNTNDDTHSIVLDAQDLLAILGVGWDGTNYEIGAIMRMSVDGTPGANDMPGRITFWTTPNGSATPAERMRIDNAGVIDMKNAQVDNDATAGNTRMLLYDVDNATLERVSVGAANSGGAGFKVLRIPN